MAKALSGEHEAFGAAVRHLRSGLDLSQEELGRRTGLHRNYIGGVERGELNPSLASINKLAKGLDVTGSALLELAESLTPTKGR